MLVEAPPRLDVRVVRERLGLTQGELAARLRVDRSRVARWERGDHVPAQAQAARCASWKLGRRLSCAWRASGWVLRRASLLALSGCPGRV